MKIEKITCKLCNREISAIVFHKHLKTHNLTNREYYDKYLKENAEDKCNYCSKKVKFISITRGYRLSCGQSCGRLLVEEKIKQTKLERYGDSKYNNSNKMKQTKKEKYGDFCYNNREQANKTCLEKYGVENPYQAEEIKEKCKHTKLERHNDINYNNREQAKETYINNFGVEHPCKLLEIIQKIKQTKLERYNNLNYINIKKSKQTCLEKYGVKYSFQSNNNKEKSKQTCLKRYGVENFQQSSIVNTTGYGYKNSWHDYHLPSGKWIKLQGYEPQILDILLQTHNEQDILYKKSDMPKIWYYTKDNKIHRYFPDFYIPKDNLIIEVKSTYTYNNRKEINFLKERATRQLGYNYNLIIYK